MTTLTLDHPAADAGGRHAANLPFGAQPVDGGTRFRLWAPAWENVALRLAGRDRDLEMEPLGDGVFELTVTGAGAGTAYHYVLPDGQAVPDPVSRAQAGDVHGPSVVVDPCAYRWASAGWRGRPWAGAVVYELHAGLHGGFSGVEAKLEELAALGVTAIELMPAAQFSGERGWGYDGVLLFAPHRAYGGPEGLKRLVDAAHQRGLMMLLDVVYNHFGPDGNYLHLLAPDFFTSDHQTPWGAAIDFGHARVREFFCANALMWLEEYQFDGLRLDAVHAMPTEFRDRFLSELADRVAPLRRDRHIHLVLENDANEAHFLGQGRFDAQWNDDIHHALHVIATGERDGYYEDYAEDPVADLGRALAEGFVYQGEVSKHRDGAARGESSAHLHPTCFVSFLQNHDQVGNRAMGERLSALAEPDAVGALTTLHLIAPQIPLLFMGEEDAAQSPFLYFCDFHDELADAVREGRRKEFSRFAAFASEEARRAIPDPNAAETFVASRVSGRDPEHRALVRDLLALRQARIAPLLKAQGSVRAGYARWGEAGLSVHWGFGKTCLWLTANLGAAEADAPQDPAGERLAAWPADLAHGRLMPGWSVSWTLTGPDA